MWSKSTIIILCIEILIFSTGYLLKTRRLQTFKSGQAIDLYLIHWNVNLHCISSDYNHYSVPLQVSSNSLNQMLCTRLTLTVAILYYCKRERERERERESSLLICIHAGRFVRRTYPSTTSSCVLPSFSCWWWLLCLLPPVLRT